MKKLLLLFLLGYSITFNAQVLLTENSASLNIGNVGTELTGVTSGQGGWLTRLPDAASGSNASFQIVDLASTYGNAIQITGHSGAAATTGNPSNTRFMSKNIATEWSNRTVGNNITEVEYDFFTGPATTSFNTMRVVLYDSATLTKILAGFMITMNPLSIRALAYYDPTIEGGTGAIGNYSIPLGTNNATPPVLSQVTLLPDTWYKIGFSYNYTTGQLRFKDSNNLITRTILQGAAANTVVDNLQIIATAGVNGTIANAAASTGTFDNIAVEATSADALLSVNPISNATRLISVYPNPATNFVTIATSDTLVTNIELTDLNGRIIKSIILNNSNEHQINISDLAQGVYLLKISSDEGTITRKFIKE